MQVLEMYNNGQSKGFFSLEDIHILNSLHLIPETKEVFDEFIQEEIDFKANLVEELEGYIEPIPDEDGLEESLCQMEGFNESTVRDLICKIKMLTSDDVKLLHEALFSAKKFFELFMIDDPMRELVRLKKMQDAYEKGYAIYQKAYEDMCKINKSELQYVKKELETIKSVSEGSFMINDLEQRNVSH
ncbi:MAG TPA: hypothetical protein DEF42_15805 [Desulfosporosinus sp.]|nr:hypothetical protein [Desulfosporosinus sp.]